MTVLLTSCALPSVKEAVAENCICAPADSVAFVGATTSETAVAGLTVSDADPVIAPTFAEIVAVPTPAPLASPAEFTGPICRLEDVQPADCVTSWIEPSLYIAVAENCCVVPLAIDVTPGLRAIDVTTGGVTDNAAELLIDPKVALTLAVPIPAPDTSPPVLTRAALESEAQVTEDVRSCVLPSV